MDEQPRDTAPRSRPAPLRRVLTWLFALVALIALALGSLGLLLGLFAVNSADGGETLLGALLGLAPLTLVTCWLSALLALLAKMRRARDALLLAANLLLYLVLLAAFLAVLIIALTSLGRRAAVADLATVTLALVLLPLNIAAALAAWRLLLRDPALASLD